MKIVMAYLGVLALAFAASGCGQTAMDPKAALDSIKAEELAAHTRTLATDEYEGRAPASKGEELTTKYLSDQFQKIGLKPGNTDGTYIQNVPLVGISVDPATQLTFEKGGQKESLKYSTDFQALTRRMVDEVSINDDVVFVGYGVVAPEFNWDDYKGVDV
ncbi:MAG: peptidase M28, partial [Acidobacteria bacterium]|nr:peptidase M28 [Acidobacteriota bacterium]